MPGIDTGTDPERPDTVRIGMLWMPIPIRQNDAIRP